MGSGLLLVLVVRRGEEGGEGSWRELPKTKERLPGLQTEIGRLLPTKRLEMVGPLELEAGPSVFREPEVP